MVTELVGGKEQLERMANSLQPHGHRSPGAAAQALEGALPEQHQTATEVRPLDVQLHRRRADVVHRLTGGSVPVVVEGEAAQVALVDGGRAEEGGAGVATRHQKVHVAVRAGARAGGDVVAEAEGEVAQS